MPKLLNISEASEMLKLKPATIYKLTSAKKIPHYKLGNALRFKETDLEEWVDEQRIVPISKS